MNGVQVTKSDFLRSVRRKNPGQKEFIQAVSEVIGSVWEIYLENPVFRDADILQRLVEPERIIIFRVPWQDDQERPKINRGFRVQFSSVLGPYKGGLRFRAGVDLSILKFLGFEQIFKNALTTLPLGGGKGGSDFDPKGRSDGEIMRFCQSFMTELQRHIGNRTDIPAGDIGVGTREIGYLYGQYKRLKNHFTGTITGKSLNWGGSLMRPEATGYGVVYLTEEIMKTCCISIEGKTVLVSGSGNVAQHTVKKVNELGGKVVSMSDSSGYIYDPDGIRGEKWDYIMDLKNVRRGRIYEYAEAFGCQYVEGKGPWDIPCDVAIPCATQNEIHARDAATLIKNGCRCLAEGANMPCTPEAVDLFLRKRMIYAPGKAANAGGVATSALEMSQNFSGQAWSMEKVDTELRRIMVNIHEQCVEYGRVDEEYVDYQKGANVAAFLKVAQAMIEQGNV
ncbi:MAG: NADP-specific glutamate dehydrogenase [Fidelibacterota bacterium]